MFDCMGEVKSGSSRHVYCIFRGHNFIQCDMTYTTKIVHIIILFINVQK